MKGTIAASHHRSGLMLPQGITQGLVDTRPIQVGAGGEVSGLLKVWRGLAAGSKGVATHQEQRRESFRGGAYAPRETILVHRYCSLF